MTSLSLIFHPYKCPPLCFMLLLFISMCLWEIGIRWQSNLCLHKILGKGRLVIIRAF